MNMTHYIDPYDTHISCRSPNQKAYQKFVLSVRYLQTNKPTRTLFCLFKVCKNSKRRRKLPFLSEIAKSKITHESWLACQRPSKSTSIQDIYLTCHRPPSHAPTCTIPHRLWRHSSLCQGQTQGWSCISCEWWPWWVLEYCPDQTYKQLNIFMSANMHACVWEWVGMYVSVSANAGICVYIRHVNWINQKKRKIIAWCRIRGPYTPPPPPPSAP